MHKDTFQIPWWPLTLASPFLGSPWVSPPGLCLKETLQTHPLRAQESLGQCIGAEEPGGLELDSSSAV